MPAFKLLHSRKYLDDAGIVDSVSKEGTDQTLGVTIFLFVCLSEVGLPLL